MVEVQNHGFQFEKWVGENFFGGYSGDYTQEWDIPAAHNTSNRLPANLQGLNVSIKTAKHGSPIGLGDAIRQRSINDAFIMIVGFWNQRTPDEKWFEEIGVSKFTAENWDGLWGTISLKSLKKLDSEMKTPGLHYLKARKIAQDWKKQTIKPGNQIIINPKADSKKQRRIQCSLPFKTFWKCIGKEPVRKDSPELFGRTFQNPINSPSRTFNRN